MRTNVLQTGTVVAGELLCREHYRLTLHVDALSRVQAGQFVHLSPEQRFPGGYHTRAPDTPGRNDEWLAVCNTPMLRRAFSIAGVTRSADGVHMDIIYRVVGSATHWLATLRAGDRVSVLGPLGNGFPIRTAKPTAWLVAGGVGLPPMLYFAEALRAADRQVVAFFGAQTIELLPLSFDADAVLAADASRASRGCAEFGRNGVGVVISTDDGSLGFAGHVGEAMAAYHQVNPTVPDELVIYTCGPEPLMRFVAEYALARGIECQVCMERSMACGTGMCQSCVIPVRDAVDADGWRYQLCCTDGPVFDAGRIIWGPVDAAPGVSNGASRKPV